MTPEQLQAAQAAAMQRADDRTLTPHPGGLPGRIADATAAEAEAINAGNIDAAIGAAMLARALTDAALAEPQHGVG